MNVQRLGRALTSAAAVCVALVPGWTTATSAIELVDALVSRHILWLGGSEALDRMEAVRITGRLEVSGLSGTLSSVQRRDLRQRTDYDLAVVQGSQGVAPDTAWVMDGSGRIEPMGSAEAAAARLAIGRSFGAHFRGEDGSAREDLGVEERDGVSWRVVRFVYPTGDTYDLLLDPEDGACTWVRENRDTEVFWTRLEDWRVIDGLRFPFRSEEHHSNPAANQTVIVERVEVNPEIDVSLFDPPRRTARLHTIEGGAPATGWMPIELFRDAYIRLRGSVNGHETDLLLDSGAGMTVLDRAYAESLGIATAGDVVARGVAGESSASFAKGVTVRVGALELRDLTAAVIDLQPIAARLGRPLPAILGKEVFHALVVDLDYPERRIRFVEPEGFEYDGPGRRLPVHPAQDGHKEIEISVEDLPPARVGLDTGAGGALDLFAFYVEENGLLESRERVSEWLTGGVGGMTTESLTTLRTVRIAGYTLSQVPIGVPNVEVGAFATRRTAGNLGAGVLKRFRVLFDYAHDCLWLEPRPGTESDPFERDRAGLVVDRKDGALEILMVAPGSPAAAAGWKAGERIAGVNGTPVGATYADAVDRFGRGADGTEVRLTMEDGSERRLRLATYY